MNSNALFEEVVVFLIKEIEGGEVDDASDAGGHTNYGISKKSYPDIDISNLSMQDAISIYRRDYWDAYQCAQLPACLAIFLFDSVVNHRPKTAVRLLQSALQAGLKYDGIMGSKTIRACNTAFDLDVVLINALAARAQLYHDIVQCNSSQAKFLRGWFSRLFKVHNFIKVVSSRRD